MPRSMADPSLPRQMSVSAQNLASGGLPSGKATPTPRTLPRYVRCVDIGTRAYCTCLSVRTDLGSPASAWAARVRGPRKRVGHELNCEHVGRKLL